MLLLTSLAWASVPIVAFAPPHVNNSLSFTLSANVCNPDLIQGACLYNHPITIGNIDARDYKLHSDLPGVSAKTSCPLKKGCPKNDGSTQFNTTIAPPIDSDQTSGPGQVFMNSVALQKLYVQPNGLIAYSQPDTPNKIPTGAHDKLWYLQPYTEGSCLNCGFALAFNTTDSAPLLYTCKNPAAPGNLTYAAIPGGKDVSKCTGFVAVAGAFCTTQEPDTTCGNNAYEYN